MFEIARLNQDTSCNNRKHIWRDIVKFDVWNGSRAKHAQVSLLTELGSAHEKCDVWTRPNIM